MLSFGDTMLTDGISFSTKYTAAVFVTLLLPWETVTVKKYGADVSMNKNPGNFKRLPSWEVYAFIPGFMKQLCPDSREQLQL